jgi:hypothetical protein
MNRRELLSNLGGAGALVAGVGVLNSAPAIAAAGSNFSDVFVVEPSGPSLQMSRLPWSEEWMWIEI